MAKDICFTVDTPLIDYSGMYEFAVDYLDSLHDAAAAQWEQIDEATPWYSQDSCPHPEQFSKSDYFTNTAITGTNANPFGTLAAFMSALKSASEEFNSDILKAQAQDAVVYADDNTGTLMTLLTDRLPADKLYTLTLSQINELTSNNLRLEEWHEGYQKKIEDLPSYSPGQKSYGWYRGNCLGDSISVMYELGLQTCAALTMQGDLGEYMDRMGNMRQAFAEDYGTGSAKNSEAALKENQEDFQALEKAVVASFWRTQINFKEQCFLLAQIYNLAGAKRELERIPSSSPMPVENESWVKPLPYYANAGNASLLVNGDPYGFMNRVTQHPAQNKFFDMATPELSSLQPMIRIFKVFDENGTEYQHEFNFDAYASAGDVESLFADTTKRGFGTGIKDFSFTYDGNNPFAAKKSIKAKLTIFASSFDELLKLRTATYKDNTDPDNPKYLTRPYQYAQLALKTWSDKRGAANEPDVNEPLQCSWQNSPEAQSELSKLHFRLKAIVGFARPVEETWFTNKTESERQALLSAIAESYVTLNLTPTIHEFNIDDMGRVTFTINYLAFVEDFYDQPQFDIFYEEGVAIRVMARKYQYEELSKLCKSEEIAEWKESLAKNGDIRVDKFENMRSLLTRMREADKIRYINVTHQTLKTFNTLGPFFEQEGGPEILDSPADELDTDLMNEYKGQWEDEGAADEKLKSQLELSLRATNPTEENIGFFYVSDLLDVILHGIGKRLETFSDGDVYDHGKLLNLDEEEKDQEIDSHKQFKKQFEKFRAVLGPVEIMDPRDGETMRHINFGDVPVSVRYFLEWLTDKLLKREETRYNLSKFLNDLLNDLVKNFLNNDTCFRGFSTKQKVRVNQAAVTSYKDSNSKHDEITKYLISHGNTSVLNIKAAGLPIPLLNISGPRDLPLGDGGVQNEMNYLVYFAGRTQPIEKMNGKRSEDESNGIFHYLIGRPRGIVKTISLSKTDAKYLKEVRFQKEGFDGLQQLREVYDVNVDCYANAKTFPGTYIFVDPRGFAPNTVAYDSEELLLDLTRYGIGGYCMIIRSEHNFAPGKAETKITAKWVAQIEGEQENQECEDARERQREAGTNSKSKCPAWVKNLSNSEDKGFFESLTEEKILELTDTVTTKLDEGTEDLF